MKTSQRNWQSHTFQTAKLPEGQSSIDNKKETNPTALPPGYVAETPQRLDLYKRIALWKFNSPGGHDNVPALIRAWELAAAAQAGVVVWIHGPQPVALESVEDLRQRFERSAKPPRFYDVETQVGPDRILERLDGLTSIRTVLRLGDLGDDLQRLFSSWSNSSGSLTLIRQSAPPPTSALHTPGTEASLHLARLWAADEVTRLSAARQFQAAAELAARHQLVTPVSGAVVLETQAQYDSAGLQPVPSDSVPAVPEPSTATLLLLFLFTLALCRALRFRTAKSVPANLE